ncbi:inverse autotransporter beta domain-containing protein [Pararhizobium sp.]|uniref:inverse autotransporter beta domain-containing protein n=1 Tax=Pararhizobium sp. TaxID=1977563 RepID=UPI0027209541|nr:inverse autotransporter beta domain-containing protein [Pararhizobium sp.]MDO9415427.1 inverse autotransporter beta domain-containing protein [Pararhizobium sp.]
MMNTSVCASDFNSRWGASVDVGGRVGQGREIGETSLFAPLWQNDTSLFFTDLRGSFDDSHAREGNFGLGFRHMLDSGWNIGAYSYFDVRRSALGNTFHQATFGLEALSESFDLRANVYLPVGDSEKAFDTASVRNTGPELVLTGNQLAIQRSTTTSVFTMTEKAMKGFDAEVGLRLPVLPDDWNVDLRAFAGGYHFEADGVQDISGPRGRLELSARDVAGLPGVRLTAGLTYQHDQVRGSQWIAGARLTIPLQAPSRAEDREPLTYMQQRMTEGVVRDVDIVAGSRTERTSEIKQVSTEAAVNTWNEQTVTSVTYLDPTGGAAGLNAALAGTAGSVVVLNGALTGITDLVTLGTNNTLLGGGTTLRVRGAETGVQLDYLAAGTAGQITGQPVTLVNGYNVFTVLQTGSVLGGMSVEKTGAMLGGVSAATVFIKNASNTSVFGNTILGGNDQFSHGIVTENAVNSKIYSNTVTTSAFVGSYGIFVDLATGTSSVVADGNTLNHNSTASAAAFSLGGGTARFSNNTIHVNPGSTVIYAFSGLYLSGSTGNTIVGTFGTQCFDVAGTGTVSFTNAPDCSF